MSAVFSTMVCFLLENGFKKSRNLDSGELWVDNKNDCAVILDREEIFAPGRPYVDYTREQNELMHLYSSLFRFLACKEEDAEDFLHYFPLLLDGDWEIPPSRQFGGARNQQAVDPTQPEELFERLFTDTFGDTALYALEREYPCTDINGHFRYIDYLLHTKHGKVAIELNGESFHHPACIGHKKYRSQLIKQNSLTASGIRVFRWSRAGMDNRERFQEEMFTFFGQPSGFCNVPAYRASRSLGYIELMAHQEDALSVLEEQRSAGKDSALLVLPTGTGKTEIALSDYKSWKKNYPETNGLFVVPTRTLKEQTLDRLRDRLPEYQHRTTLFPKSEQSGFVVQTAAYMNRNYDLYAPDAFDYLVVDEAHHAMAPGYMRFLRHFAPNFLLGLTATPERLDQKKLEEVFGDYDTTLSLQDAIREGIIPPVRAFRLKTNIDLSDVRFNGVDYTVSDLQKTVIVQSRDQLILETLRKYFSGEALPKQGLIFCVNIRHAESMAKLLNSSGILAKAVSGKNHREAEQAVEAYKQGEIQFLCSCALLNEGFDAPNTAVLVMARPTMSKALYVQQLGRGTRKFPGKEALYVIDVVDQHGPLNAPWSIHALFSTPLYAPWADMPGNSSASQEEEAFLLQLLEYERRVEEIDIFTFEEKYQGYLSEEECARELFISTDTLRKWIRKRDVTPEVSVPFGRRTLYFFSPESIPVIRKAKNLKEHSAQTILEDFQSFLEERDYALSYKMVMMLSFLKHIDAHGAVDIDLLAEEFAGFFRWRIENNLPVDRKSCPLNTIERIEDSEEVISSILRNPFEKFERKRFMHHARDLKSIEFSFPLWEKLSANPEIFAQIRQQMIDDMVNYYNSLGGIDAQQISDRYPLSPSLDKMLTQKTTTPGMDLSELLIPVEPDRNTLWKTCLPYFDNYAAAGLFSEYQEPEEMQWVSTENISIRHRPEKGMFIMKVKGHSMEPAIPDDTVCLFSSVPVGPKSGRILLVRMHKNEDPEHGGRLTVKRYYSRKKSSRTEEEGFNETIELRPDNPDYPPLIFSEDDAAELKVLGEFLECVKIKQG